ncbi:hypothetical protein EDB89DRAFT_1909936 [Lactarius sanguifluus]|nr:hypothetical protein EDB89DRAFT_1909936 [Lactarius sanguifluus]
MAPSYLTAPNADHRWFVHLREFYLLARVFNESTCNPQTAPRITRDTTMSIVQVSMGDVIDANFKLKSKRLGEARLELKGLETTFPSQTWSPNVPSRRMTRENATLQVDKLAF